MKGEQRLINDKQRCGIIGMLVQAKFSAELTPGTVMLYGFYYTELTNVSVVWVFIWHYRDMNVAWQYVGDMNVMQ